MFSKKLSVLVLSCVLFAVATAGSLGGLGGPTSVSNDKAEQLLSKTLLLISKGEQNTDIQ